MTLGWILGASVAGGALSVALAAFALYLRASWIPMLVSFAIGTLLGAAFLEVIPHAFDQGDAHEAAVAILGGIFGFFVLEKLMLWRHCHTEDCEAHDPHKPGTSAGTSAGGSAHAHDYGRSGALIVVGDTIHNFVDGLLIAAAFLQGTELGIVAAVAIIAHEIPQEVGDFLILLHSGYSRARALAMNLLSSLATVVGGVLGYYGLQAMQGLETYLLGIVAASMIYVAVADLIPGLHRRPELRDGATQTVLIALGIGCIAMVRMLVAH
jgi:zinc and cadmium transporter